MRTALLTAIRGSASRVATSVPGRGAVVLGALLLQFPVAPRPSGGPHSFDRRVFDDPEGEPPADSAHREFYTPHYRGIFDDQGRLLVAINNNTDLGAAGEWAERPEYPLKYSTFAYQTAVNLIVYGKSH